VLPGGEEKGSEENPETAKRTSQPLLKENEGSQDNLRRREEERRMARPRT